VKDPVCGMTVDRGAGGPSSDHRGKTYYFCGAHCKHTFDANPEAYT
jgi:P-type Cu+ transporter